MSCQRRVLLHILPAAAKLPSPSMGIASQRLAISASPPFLEYNLQPQLLKSIVFEILPPAWSRVSLSYLAVEYPNRSYKQHLQRSGNESSLGHSRCADHLWARWLGGQMVMLSSGVSPQNSLHWARFVIKYWRKTFERSRVALEEGLPIDIDAEWIWWQGTLCFRPGNVLAERTHTVNILMKPK